VEFFSSNITTSNMGILFVFNSNLEQTITIGGTSLLDVIYNSQLNGGPLSALSIGAGALCKVVDTTVNSTAINAITGTGTLEYGLITFTGSSSSVTTSTQTALTTLPAFGGGGGVTGPVSSTNTGVATWNGTGGTALFNNSTTKIDSIGRFTNSGQPAFFANNTNNLSNVTGDGTQITMTYDTVVFDQGSNVSSNTFVAPINGIYHFDASASFYNLSAATNAAGCSVSFYVNGSEYKRFTQINAGLINDTTDSNTFIAFGSTLLKLNATDVVSIRGYVFGSSKTVGLEGGPFTSFSGHLVC
jgi:hypothetical protein